MQITISGRLVGRVIAGLVIGAIIGGLAWLIIKPEPPFDGTIDESRDQAVFLSNDRVYFGHLREAGDEFFERKTLVFHRLDNGLEIGEGVFESRSVVLPFRNGFTAGHGRVSFRRERSRGARDR